MTLASRTTGGIPDPDQETVWLVCPWPIDASFCDIVGHFVRAYVWRPPSTFSTARRLAYFEGYRAALATASTHELKFPASWHWHDELLACIDECIAQFSVEQPNERQTALSR